MLGRLNKTLDRNFCVIDLINDENAENKLGILFDILEIRQSEKLAIILAHH